MINPLVQPVARRVRGFLRRTGLDVRHRSSASRVYHCCAVRTGSHWLRGILRDPIVYRYSGLRYVNYYVMVPAARQNGEHRPLDVPVPEQHIVSPLYIHLKAFRAIPQNGPYRAFFVMRDPRDLLLSWYYSIKYSHGLLGGTARWRAQLLEMPMEEGLKYSIDVLADEERVFEGLLSWVDPDEQDANILTVRFEDLVGDRGRATLQRVLKHCDINVPDRALTTLLSKHSFEALSGGRRQGQEDVMSHFRKGAPGEWKGRLGGELLEYLNARSGQAAARLGYA